MKYEALIEIGGFKKGEEVPEEKALIWKQMYKTSPVKEIEEEISVPEDNVQDEEPKVPEDVEPTPGEEEKKSDGSILNDYLARGVNVVKKNLSEDDLTREQLEELLELEKSGKKRPKVIEAIERRLEE